MKPTLTLPSNQQAVVYWLRSIEMTYTEIAKRLRISVAKVRTLQEQAQQLAKEQGLHFRYNPPEPTKVGASMTLLRELTPEPPRGGMQRLKDLAREAGLKASV